MKDFIVEVEFKGGEFDTRTVRANTALEAEQKVISQNEARMNSTMFNTKEIVKAEAN